MIAVSTFQVKAAQAALNRFEIYTYRQSFFLSQTSAFSCDLHFETQNLQAGYYNIIAIYTLDRNQMDTVAFDDDFSFAFYDTSSVLRLENIQDQPIRIVSVDADLRTTNEHTNYNLRFSIQIYCDRDIPQVCNFAVGFNAAVAIQSGTFLPFGEDKYVRLYSLQGNQPQFSLIQLTERFQFNALDQIINTLQSAQGSTVIGSLDRLNSNLAQLMGAFNDYSSAQIDEMEVLNATQNAIHKLTQSQLTVMTQESDSSNYLGMQNDTLKEEMSNYFQYTDTSDQFDQINSSGILEPDMSFWAGLTPTVQFISHNITLAFASFGDFGIPLTLMLTFVIISTIINAAAHKQ